MKDYIRLIDTFSQKLNLHFQGREYFPTLLGGIMTVLIVILSIVLALDLGNELYLKKKPTMSFNRIILSTAPKVDLNNNTMIFALMILDQNYQVFEYKNYFDIEAVLSIKEIIESSNSLNNVLDKSIVNKAVSKVVEKNLNLNFTDCVYKQQQFKDQINNKFNFESEFYAYNLNYAKCLDNYYIDQDSDRKATLERSLQILGDIRADSYSNVRFLVKKCNKKNNPNCKSDEEIVKILPRSHFGLYFIDKGIDPFLFNFPYNYFINTYFSKLDLYLSKKTDIYFKNSTVKTDIGLIFQEYKQETDFTFDYFREQTSTADSEVLFELTLNSSRDSEFLKRYYMKIQDLAAMIGGIIKVCMVIGELISRILNRHIMYTVILNKLFNFKIKTEDLEIIKSNINMNNILDKNSSNNSELSKEIVIKGNKRLNRRRSAIFLNTNAIQENIIQNQEKIKEIKENEKNQRLKLRKAKTLEKEKKLKIEIAKKEIDEKKLNKLRQEMDLLQPEEVKQIKKLRVSKALNTLDFENDFQLKKNQTQINSDKNSDINSLDNSIFSDLVKDSNKQTTNSFDKNNSLVLKPNGEFNFPNFHNTSNVNSKTINPFEIELNVLKGPEDYQTNPRQKQRGFAKDDSESVNVSNNNYNKKKEDSIPLERKNTDLFSLKLFDDYQKAKKTITSSLKDFEFDCVNTEKRNLITDSNEKIFSESEEKDSFRKRYTIQYDRQKLNNNLNDAGFYKINSDKELSYEEAKNKHTESIDNGLKKLMSNFINKRRNNIYNKSPKAKRKSIPLFSSEQKIEGEIIDLEELNNNHKNNNSQGSFEMAANLAFFKNLQQIEEKKADKSHSILINNSQLKENLNFIPDTNKEELQQQQNDYLNTSNYNIKKFIKANHIELSRSTITNNTQSDNAEDEEEEQEDNFYADNNIEGKNQNEKKLKIIKGQLFDKYEHKMKSSVNRLDPGPFKILGFLFCRCKKRVKQEIIFMNECQKLMGNYLDYLRIIKFLKEFNRLKKILFSDSQLKIFSYLPKPNLRFKNNELKIDSLYGDIFNDKEKNNKKSNNIHIEYSKLFESYVKILGANTSDCEANKKINKRMITYMDKEMKHCFEEVVKSYIDQVIQ